MIYFKWGGGISSYLQCYIIGYLKLIPAHFTCCNQAWDPNFNYCDVTVIVNCVSCCATQFQLQHLYFTFIDTRELHMLHQPLDQLCQIMDHLARLLDMHHQLHQGTTSLGTNHHLHNQATNLRSQHNLVTSHLDHQIISSLQDHHNQVINSQLPNQQHR